MPSPTNYWPRPIGPGDGGCSDMPCHPDRVRRHYVESPAERRLTTGQPVTCAKCGKPDYPSHELWMGHTFVPPGPMAITDEGFTANVIEGEEH